MVLLAAGGIACGGSDGRDAAVATPMKVEVVANTAANRRPTVRSLRIEPAAPLDGDRVHAIASVEDSDGDPIELRFLWRVAGRRVSTTESSIELSGVSKGNRIEVEVMAHDGQLSSDTARAHVEVPNRRPTLIGVGLRPEKEVLPGELLVASAQAEDPDGDIIEYDYRWRVNGEELSSREPKLETDALAKGDEIQVWVTASDGTARSDELESVTVTVGNSHPEITSVPEVTWSDGEFHYAVEARDPDGDGPLRYALRSGPDGMVVDPVLGEVSWKPAPDQTGVHPIEVAVTDSHGAASVQIFEVTVKWTEEEPGSLPASLRD